MTRLREELSTTEESLQASTEEREAANAELKSSNAKLQSANEKLTTVNEVPPRAVQLVTAPISNSSLIARGEAVLYHTAINNMTELHAAQGASRESEERFRALVENSAEGICILNADGMIQFASQSTRHVLGFEIPELVGQNMTAFLDQPEIKRVQTELANLASADADASIELTVCAHHRDGSWRWIECRIANLLENPAVRGFALNFRDITERRHDSEALRASSTFLQLALQSAQAGTWHNDLIKKQDRWSDEIYELYGVPRTTPASYENWLRCIHPEDRAATDKVVRQVVAQRLSNFRVEFRIVHPTRGIRWLATQGRAEYLDGKPIFLAGINIDITEQKQQEQERERLFGHLKIERSRLAVQYAVVRALSEAETLEKAAREILRAFCENIGWQIGGFWQLDRAAGRLNSVFIWQQPEADSSAEFAEKSRAMIFKKSEGLPGRVWASGQPVWVRDISRAPSLPRARLAKACGIRAGLGFPILANGEIVGVIEFFNQKVIEPQKALLSTVSAMGGVIGLFIQRTEAQTELQRTKNELEIRVRQRTAALRTVNDELGREITERNRLERESLTISEREQRRLGQDLHDDVCQELTGVAMMSRVVAKQLHRQGIAESAQINQIAELVNHAVTHVRNIAHGLHPVEVDAHGLMIALQNLASRVNGAMRCRFECGEPISVAQNDVALNLYRIAQEAVSNAVKHSRARNITISLERKENQLLLDVRDDGCGLRRNGDGSGMGLHLMNYRARSIGATLRIRRLKSGGTLVACARPVE